MKINKLLLIGGHGYIGETLQKYLKNDFNVIAPTRLELDLLKPDHWKNSLGEFDLTINLASKVKSFKPHDSVENLFHENLDSVQNLLQFINTKFLINISSMVVYGKQTSVAIDEQNPLLPGSLYGLSKKVAEDLVALRCQNFALKAVNLRIPGIYGGNRFSGLIHNAKIKATKHEPIAVQTKGLINWETMHVEDLAKTITNFIKAYSYSNNYDVFNLGYGEKIDVIETINFIVNELKSKSLVTIEEKDYDDFYMKNNKIKSVCEIQGDFKSTLKSYLRD